MGPACVLFDPAAAGRLDAGVSLRVGLTGDCSPGVMCGGIVDRIGGGGGVTRRNDGRTWGGGLVGGGTEGCGVAVAGG